jgi:hypothetical protein
VEEGSRRGLSKWQEETEICSRRRWQMASAGRENRVTLWVGRFCKDDGEGVVKFPCGRIRSLVIHREWVPETLSQVLSVR